MDHSRHRPGTVRGCPDCLRFAYEPGWYATLATVDPPLPMPVLSNDDRSVPTGT